jgi:protocatechuate 4,5-dioxygenase alpha chain
MSKNDLHDVPGTYVFDKAHSRKGYHLNMFCMSLNEEANRKAFRADEAEYVSRYPMTAEQRKSVLERDWLGMLQLGGNIYYTFKIAAFDRVSMQAVGGAMSGITEDEFRQIMLTGGKDEQGAPRNGPNVLERNND